MEGAENYVSVRKSFLVPVIHHVGRDSVVGIATRYGLDGPEIESRWGASIFRTSPDRPWGPPSLLYKGYRVSFPGIKRPGRGVDHPPPYSAEVKERVELYLYSSSGDFMACSRLNFTFTFIHQVLFEFSDQVE
jgi:hypothetical protein